MATTYWQRICEERDQPYDPFHDHTTEQPQPGPVILRFNQTGLREVVDPEQRDAGLRFIGRIEFLPRRWEESPEGDWVCSAQILRLHRFWVTNESRDPVDYIQDVPLLRVELED